MGGKTRGQLWLSLVQYLPPCPPCLGSSGEYLFEYLFVSLSMGSLFFGRVRAVLEPPSFGWWWICSGWDEQVLWHSHEQHLAVSLRHNFPVSVHLNPQLILK